MILLGTFAHLAYNLSSSADYYSRAIGLCGEEEKIEVEKQERAEGISEEELSSDVALLVFEVEARQKLAQLASETQSLSQASLLNVISSYTQYIVICSVE